MHIEKFALSPPSLDKLAERLKTSLDAHYEHASVSVVSCPDLRNGPFHLAIEGLTGEERIAEVGGQSNLFPTPIRSCKWSMLEIAKAMEMNAQRGSLIGAGAGPFYIIGQNSELCPNLVWEDGFENIDNQTRFVRILPDTGAVSVEKSPSVDCALMANLFGSAGLPGPVLKITARKRKGAATSFTENIQKGLHAAYGDDMIVSLGGAVLIKSGKTNFHVMPDFPPDEQLPFKDITQLTNWLTYHDYDDPVVCLSVINSVDPGKAKELRLEHSHGFSPSGGSIGGHYHYETSGPDDTQEEVEYEAYFNTAKFLYRIDQPATPFDQA